MFSKIVFILLITVIIYGSLAALLIFFGVLAKKIPSKNNLVFDELRLDYTGLPELQEFKARNETTLFYRHYPAQTDLTLVLLHGSGWHSRYFFT